MSAAMANRLLGVGIAGTVIAAGGGDRSLWVRMPIGCGGAFHHPRLNWRFTTEPDEGLGGRQSYWPRGKVVGGSSAINGMVFVRGQAADFDEWAAAGDPGWDHASVSPYFRRLEDNLCGADERASLVIAARLQKFDTALEEAALDTGRGSACRALCSRKTKGGSIRTV